MDKIYTNDGRKPGFPDFRAKNRVRVFGTFGSKKWPIFGPGLTEKIGQNGLFLTPKNGPFLVPENDPFYRFLAIFETTFLGPFSKPVKNGPFY